MGHVTLLLMLAAFDLTAGIYKVEINKPHNIL